MICNGYVVDHDALLNLLNEGRFKRILIQAPDGLKTIYPCLLGLLKEKAPPGVEIILSSSPTFGGCDVAYEEARMVRAELIIHIGHNRYPWFIQGEIPVYYIPAYYDWSPSFSDAAGLIDVLRAGGFKRICLSASIQHVKSLVKLKGILEEAGFEPYIPRHNGLEDGQILGCYYSHAKAFEKMVDSYVVVSGGLFHPLGLALTTNKPVIGFDPYTLKAWDASSIAKRVLAKRFYLVSKLKYSGFRRACVIIGCKPGQYRPAVFEEVKRVLDETGCETLCVSSCTLDRDRLISIDSALKPDVFVVTSCPRLPIDDLDDFYKPVVTPGEIYMAVKGADAYIYPW